MNKKSIVDERLIMILLFFGIFFSGCSPTEYTMVDTMVEGEGVEYINISYNHRILYMDYHDYQIIQFKTGGSTTYTYLNIIVRCEDKIVCYTNNLEEGGLSCFRQKDLVDKYCNTTGEVYTKEVVEEDNWDEIEYRPIDEVPIE